MKWLVQKKQQHLKQLDNEKSSFEDTKEYRTADLLREEKKKKTATTCNATSEFTENRFDSMRFFFALPRSFCNLNENVIWNMEEKG